MLEVIYKLVIIIGYTIFYTFYIIFYIIYGIGYFIYFIVSNIYEYISYNKEEIIEYIEKIIEYIVALINLIKNIIYYILLFIYYTIYYICLFLYNLWNFLFPSLFRRKKIILMGLPKTGKTLYLYTLIKEIQYKFFPWNFNLIYPREIEENEKREKYRNNYEQTKEKEEIKFKLYWNFEFKKIVEFEIELLDYSGKYWKEIFETPPKKLNSKNNDSLKDIIKDLKEADGIIYFIDLEKIIENSNEGNLHRRYFDNFIITYINLLQQSPFKTIPVSVIFNKLDKIVNDEFYYYPNKFLLFYKEILLKKKKELRIQYKRIKYLKKWYGIEFLVTSILEKPESVISPLEHIIYKSLPFYYRLKWKKIKTFFNDFIIKSIVSFIKILYKIFVIIIILSLITLIITIILSLISGIIYYIFYYFYNFIQ